MKGKRYMRKTRFVSCGKRIVANRVLSASAETLSRVEQGMAPLPANLFEITPV